MLLMPPYGGFFLGRECKEYMVANSSECGNYWM